MHPAHQPDDQPEAIPSPPGDDGPEDSHQLEVLISLALLLGGIALCVNSKGSVSKLAGGIALFVLGGFALSGMVRTRHRRRKGLPAKGDSPVIHLVVFPVAILLTLAALLAPLALAYKAAKVIRPDTFGK